MSSTEEYRHWYNDRFLVARATGADYRAYKEYLESLLGDQGAMDQERQKWRTQGRDTRALVASGKILEPSMEDIQKKARQEAVALERAREERIKRGREEVRQRSKERMDEQKRRSRSARIKAEASTDPEECRFHDWVEQNRPRIPGKCDCGRWSEGRDICMFCRRQGSI